MCPADIQGRAPVIKVCVWVISDLKSRLVTNYLCVVVKAELKFSKLLHKIDFAQQVDMGQGHLDRSMISNFVKSEVWLNSEHDVVFQTCNIVVSEVRQTEMNLAGSEQ